MNPNPAALIRRLDCTPYDLEWIDGTARFFPYAAECARIR
jgi:hypothetical protein